MDRQSVLKKRSLLTITAVLLLVVGILIGRNLAPSEEGNAHNGPHESGETPLIDAKSEAGAVALATEFARTLSGAIDDADSYHRLIRGFAAPEWESEAERLAENTLRFVIKRYGEDADLSFAPIRYRVSHFSEDRAVVELWGVTVATGSKIVGIEESWITGRIDLRWLGNRWLVVDQDSQSGPTPELLRSVDEVAPSVLQDFQEYKHAGAS